MIEKTIKHNSTHQTTSVTYKLFGRWVVFVSKEYRNS